MIYTSVPIVVGLRWRRWKTPSGGDSWALCVETGCWTETSSPPGGSLTVIFSRRPSREWIEWLNDADVPAASVRTVFEAAEGERLSDEPAPRQGEHTVEVLREAGFQPAEIETFTRSGVIRTSA